jgi:hypothetical protein
MALGQVASHWLTMAIFWDKAVMVVLAKTDSHIRHQTHQVHLAVLR